MNQIKDRQALPTSAEALCSGDEVARFLAERFLEQRSALLLRYGDTGGRIIARPETGTPEYAYLQTFLGSSVTPDQVDWMGRKIAQSVTQADVIGLRSDLLSATPIPDTFFAAPKGTLRERLCALYPIRRFEQNTLSADGALRLGQTRRAMEAMALPAQALLTDAWVHVALAENGFLSALMRQAPGISICTSSQSRQVLKQMATTLKRRLRLFDCPAHPAQEAQWGGDHAFLWQRWQGLVQAMRPSYPGEPLLISAGIWTKIIGPAWARAGGIAIDMGSVMDYFAGNPSRPAVLATRYDDPGSVPEELSFTTQIKGTLQLEDFLT